MVDLLPDGAYWVDDIRPRNQATTPAGDAVVDLMSDACSAATEKTTTIQYSAGVDPTPWIGQHAVVTGTAPRTPGIRISGTLTNVGEVKLDTAAACIPAGKPIRFDIAVDGPTVVRFADGRPALRLG